MWHIAIKYRSNTEDIVPPFMLDELITSDRIKQFFRPSEKKWITPGVDRIRKAGDAHRNPERRRPICNAILIPDPSSRSF
jgi:hypothetical protein